ncbi:FAD-linked oxidoreductase [Mumia flava]|uniref:FAD-linked oxidoreductase n=1 Tax=Mumia flava TaxID=1348852 RepID=A0A0B2BTQ1_9ACTN|nr:D-arabinono-1,4-lactone oxidase [Mumia flava]PJJ57082.1 FAD-linked oxidoreductase [Mumia flava]
MSSTGAGAWTNWARTVTSEPTAVVHPRSAAEVAEIVRTAAAQGQRVKPVGAGHSFTAIAQTDGVLLRMDQIAGIQHVDHATGHVRVGAGTRLHDLNPALLAHGLALPNMGDVDPQTMSGATATGTHGTGAKLTGIAGAIAALEIVTGDGTIVEVTSDDKDLFGAARVGLGALGIVTAITFACVPAFLLHAREEPMRLPEVLDGLDALVDDNDHFEFYWFPHTDCALLKRNNRVPEGTVRAPLSKARFLLDDEVLSNGGFEIVNRVGRLRPSWIPRLNAFSGGLLSAREYTDWSHEVFVSPRRVRFREMEYAIPRAHLPEVLRAIDGWVNASGEQISFPIEVRFAAPDDIWLSTGYERENAYVAVHMYHRSDHRRYFEGIEAIFGEHEGRPHWGKMHTLDADALRTRYPRFDDFRAVRDRLDPQRTFTNSYLDRVLG